MKTLDKSKFNNYVINLTPAIPYLEALEAAEHFPELFILAQRHEDDANNYYDQLMEDAMDQIETYCPWLWPAIDLTILNIVDSR